MRAEVPTYRHRPGFSLVELAVTLVVLGLLAAVAVPAGRAVLDHGADDTDRRALQALAERISSRMAFHRELTGQVRARTGLSEAADRLPDGWTLQTDGTLTSTQVGQVVADTDGPVARLAMATATGGCARAAVDAETVAVWDDGPTPCSPQAAAGFTAAEASTVPEPPTSVQPTAGSGAVTVTWQLAATGPSADSVHVTVTPARADGRAVSRVPATETGTTVDGLTPGTTYTLVVVAVNEAGQSAEVSVQAQPLA